jgi:uncharacterized protein YecT (DUF1311 family)
MHKSLTAILLAPLLLACTKEPPKCSDAATVALVKEIIFDKLGLDAAARDKIGVRLLDSILTLENMRPSAYEEKIKKFSCEATLVAKRDRVQGDSYRLPIHFESQLDDKNGHIVALKDVLIADLRQVDIYLAAAIENDRKKADNKNIVPSPAGTAGAVAEQAPKESVPEPGNEQASASTSDEGGTVEQSGVCKGLDLAITVDQSECVSRKYTIADKKLNDEYKRIMGSLSPARQSELKTTQLVWIKEKERTCAAAGKEVEGGSLEPIVIADCEVRMTEERNAFLANYR